MLNALYLKHYNNLKHKNQTFFKLQAHKHCSSHFVIPLRF